VLVGALLLFVSGTVVATEARTVARPPHPHVAAAPDIYLNVGAIAGEQPALSKRIRSALVKFFAKTPGASPGFVKLTRAFDTRKGAFLAGQSRFFTLAEQAGTNFVKDGSRPQFSQSLAAAENSWIKSAGSFGKAPGTGAAITGLTKAELSYFAALVANADALGNGSVGIPASRSKYEQITLDFGLTVDSAFAGWINQAPRPSRRRLLRLLAAANRAFYKSTVASEDSLLTTLSNQPSPTTTTTTGTTTATTTTTTASQASTITITCSNPAGPSWPGNSAVHISGAISPPVSAAAVSLIYQPPSGSAITHTAQTNSSGDYQDSLTPTPGGTLQSGRWNVTASWSGNNTYAGTQNSCSFTVS
jgi:hypothetical protein